MASGTNRGKCHDRAGESESGPTNSPIESAHENAREVYMKMPMKVSTKATCLCVQSSQSPNESAHRNYERVLTGISNSAHEVVHEMVWSRFIWSVFICSVPRPILEARLKLSWGTRLDLLLNPDALRPTPQPRRPPNTSPQACNSDTPIPAFFVFLTFFRFAIFLAFLVRFCPFFPRILGVRQMVWGFRAFLAKKQGLEGQGLGPNQVKIRSKSGPGEDVRRESVPEG